MLELKILPEIRSRLFPLREEELAELERSVLEEGIRDPLVVWRKGDELILVDGHTRYELAKKHDLPFTIVERNFESLEEVLIWIDRNQLARRNLTDEQRALVIGRLYKAMKLSQGRPTGGKEEKFSSFSGSDATARTIAVQVGINERTVRNAAKFAEALETLQEISPQAAQRILRGEVKDAKTVLPKVPDEVMPAVAKEIEQGSRSIRQVLQEFRAQNLKAPPLPEGEFDVIYADPPWEYEFSPTESRAIENQYPTMSLDELKRMKIPAAPNAVLFLWATPPKLAEALELMQAWGFRYVTCAVWDKEKIGMGFWFRQQHELLLVGVKGSVSPPPPSSRFPSVIRSPRTEHSRKPEIVYEMIEAMFPNNRYLELFSRNRRKGWTAWGNEV